MKVLEQNSGKMWQAYHGDCVEVSRGIPDNSVYFIVFSPPFESLYTYSNSDRDMGNCRNSMEFARHFRFLAKELYRILIPGRCMSVHCMDLPLSKQRDGVIGLRDFSGCLVRIFERAGFVMHTPRVTIRKDPVTAMQRTSARDSDDERHIAPLQLEVIERAITMWTNPGDIVFTPFMGIGSECYQAVKMGRKGIGVELKDSYYRQAVKNLKRAELEHGIETESLF